MINVTNMSNSLITLLKSDGYKQVHAEQFPKGLVRLVSYMTPRKSRLKSSNEMVFWGLQAFNKKYLVEDFNVNFFNRPLEDVINEYTEVLDVMLGRGNYDLRKIIDLHKLGYLPLEISALPEGTIVPMQVPCIQITNTHKNFAWVVQWIESLLSAEIWKSCIHAGVGYSYRQIVNKYYDLTVDDNVLRSKAISDFGFRGMSGLDEATKASAAWLVSFSGTATIPAVPYLAEMYNTPINQIATNAISTEHSVMASNYAVDGDEIKFVKRLLTEIYPNASFSMVSDTYDLFALINRLPEIKEEIMNHNGKLLIRPDSGDIIEISVNVVERLWELFGGTINSKGYKVLNPKLGVVYGDGVTQQRAEAIYQALMEKGFASNCIIFGAGSFSFNCIEEDGVLKPYTRDTYSVAIKATYGEIEDENGEIWEIPIFKDPVTDTDKFKKSQKGCCIVKYDENNNLICEDEHSFLETRKMPENKFNVVFRNGVLEDEESLADIRNRLHKDAF